MSKFTMSCTHNKCILAKVAWILVIVGGLNWGLVGLGMLIGSNLNVVTFIFGSWPMVEAIVYLVVGIATAVSIFGCPCASCKESCANCTVEEGKKASM